jgi:hypothetical protein
MASSFRNWRTIFTVCPSIGGEDKLLFNEDYTVMRAPLIHYESRGPGIPAITKSQVPFAKHSVCDRQLFASETPASRTARPRFREKESVNAIHCRGSPFSLVRLVEQESRKTGIIHAFRGNYRREFSAVQTVWRSGVDSNPRYGFEALSLVVSVSCRLQMLSREFRTQTRLHSLVSSAVSIRHPFEPERRSVGDSVAEKGRFRRLLQVSKMSRSDCALSAQS